MNEEEIVKKVLNCSFRVHTKFGPGLLESVYRDCLAHSLRKENLMVEVEKNIPFTYEDLEIKFAYRADLIINQKVIVEIKTVEKIAAIHIAQALTYLKLGNFKLGLVLNFNTPHLRDGIRRVRNGF